jgi:6-pyruvoyltetrahydropterin/6-carboxytetrahydropterin synthase
MIIDFSLLKSTLRGIAKTLDHRMLIPEKHKDFRIFDDHVKVEVDNRRYVFPKTDCILLSLPSVTAENLAQYILDEILHGIDLPSNITKVEIGVDEGFSQGAWVETNVG